MAISKSKKSHSTTKLPSELINEIDDKYGKNTPARKFKSRRDTRKEERQFKKDKSKLSQPTQKKTLDPNDARTQGREKPYQKPENTNNKNNKLKAIENLIEPQKKQKGDPEDDEIAWLEYQLNNKKSDDLRDDLDDLLDDVNDIEGRILDSDSEQEDVDMIHNDDDLDDTMADSIDDDDDDDDDDDGDSANGDDNDNELMYHKSSENDLKELSIATQGSQEAKEPVKYVPPAVRAAREHELQQRLSSNVQKSEDMQKINKVVKGSLNRLSEANIETILGQLQELYRNKPRHDVTTSVTDLILSTIGSRDNMLDSFVILYAGFTGSLHRLVGIEFMAYITQTIIKKLGEKPLYQASEDEVRSHLNLISLLSELYNLGSISVSLIYDLIKSLISTDQLNEAQIDAVLRITRSAGQQLRHDDPSSLKEIVLAIQNKVEHLEKNDLSSRFKFMLECLNNLKNNKTKALNGTSNGIESRDRIKKYLKNLEKRPGVASTEALTVSLEDLRQADSKGKWWLVGSAWSGNPLVDKKEEFSKNTKTDDDVLIKLAKRQGMNTDVRRNIFIILMSSEDYIDACDRLSNLGLTEVQQREMIRVILHCGGNEKRYNPYYTLVASHLLRQSHSTRITLQYAIWDFLRELGETSVGGSEILKNSSSSGDGSNVRGSRIDNLAKGLAWWVAKSSVPLSIFKPVIFPTLSPKAKDFFNKFFVYLFLSTYSSSPTLNLDSKKGDKSIIESTMMKAAPISNLANGIKWYLNHIDLGNLKERELEITEWCINHSIETLKLGMDLSNY